MLFRSVAMETGALQGEGDQVSSRPRNCALLLPPSTKRGQRRLCAPVQVGEVRAGGPEHGMLSDAREGRVGERLCEAGIGRGVRPSDGEVPAWGRGVE